MSTSGDEIAIFRTSWSLYDAVTEHNYMSHRELYAIVDGVLGEVRETGPYSILDLGCGNARFLAPCLKAHPPCRYDGVDLSQTALEEARAFLSGMENVSLHHEDMLDATRTSGQRFDVIFAGFAVHHLDADAKQELFHACSRVLQHGGRFLMMDVMRKEGETRASYMDRYLDMVRTEWTSVPAEQREEICRHVEAHDFPETFVEFKSVADAAGFEESRILGGFGDHHVAVFQAP